MTNEQRRDLIEKIRSLPKQLELVVSSLPAEQLTTPTSGGEWTIAQNVHHIADSHMNSYIRMKLILTEDYPTLKPYDQEKWASLADGANTALENSLLVLQGLHRRWVTLFESLGEADWQRAGLHPEIGEVTIENILQIYVDHGEAHLDQIRRTLAAGGWES
jgi:hypothetical protein